MQQLREVERRRRRSVGNVELGSVLAPDLFVRCHGERSLRRAALLRWAKMLVVVATEGQALADAKADEIARLSWQELDTYGERTEQSIGPSGRVFRVRSRAYWDMEPWASGIEIIVKANAPSGIRRIWGCKARRTRGGPDDPVPPPP